jgi:hypothetical protein
MREFTRICSGSKLLSTINWCNWCKCERTTKRITWILSKSKDAEKQNVQIGTVNIKSGGLTLTLTHPVFLYHSLTLFFDIFLLDQIRTNRQSTLCSRLWFHRYISPSNVCCSLGWRVLTKMSVKIFNRGRVQFLLLHFNTPFSSCFTKKVNLHSNNK